MTFDFLKFFGPSFRITFKFVLNVIILHADILMAFKCQERSCSFSLKKVNAFEMHLEHKLQSKCKINPF